MDKNDYLRMLVDEIHSVVIATVDEAGHPQARVMDLMLWDGDGVYFTTERGKRVHEQLMEQRYVAVAGLKGQAGIMLNGEVEPLGRERVDEVLEKYPYMRELFPGKAADTLETFRICRAHGSYYDITDPANLVTDTFEIG